MAVVLDTQAKGGRDGTELVDNRYLVVIWIGWQSRLLNRPEKIQTGTAGDLRIYARGNCYSALVELFTHPRESQKHRSLNWPFLKRPLWKQQIQALD